MLVEQCPAINMDISFQRPVKHYTKMFWVQLHDKVQSTELWVKIMLGLPVALGCSVSSDSHTHCSSMPANIKFCQSETDNPLKMLSSGLWCHILRWISADISLAPTIMDQAGSLGSQCFQTCLHYVMREVFMATNVWTSKFTGNLLYREFPSFLLSKAFRFILEPSVITPFLYLLFIIWRQRLHNPSKSLYLWINFTASHYKGPQFCPFNSAYWFNSIVLK